MFSLRKVGVMVVAVAMLGAFLAIPAAAAGGQRVEVIVVYADSISNSSATTAAMAPQYDAEPRVVYEHALEGFAGSVPEGRLRALRNDPRVAHVELDQVVTLDAQTVPTGVERIYADDNANLDIDGTDDERIDADVAVIDTGIDLEHEDLNVVSSTDCTGGGPFSSTCGSGGDDDNGHGTHVAGSAAALDNGVGVVGVAPGARLHAVKVLRSDGSGYLSWIVAGIDHVTANADVIDVANMSLGCECDSEAMDSAISESVAAGVTYGVAAGNDDADSSTFSPANHPDVITVSALADFDGAPGGAGSPTCRSDQDDTLADFSNFGPDVEIAAPGVCILSAWHDGGYNTISGTSMASPHVAGAAALLTASGVATPDSVRQTIIDTGNFDWTDDSGDGIQEPLLDVSDATIYDPATTTGDGGGGDDGGDGGDGGDATGLHVESLSATTTSNGSQWTSTLTVLVHDDSSAAADVTVEVSWLSQRGVDGQSVCTTNSDGTCSLDPVTLHKRDSYVDYGVGTLTSSDGSVEDGSTLRVHKP